VKDSVANVSAAPSVSAEPRSQVASGESIAIDDWVAGDQIFPSLITWGHLADGRGYVYGSAIRPLAPNEPPTPPAETAGWTGRWIDVNLTQNLITPYDGQAAGTSYPTSPGKPGWETTRGIHHVRYQMPVQDMAGPGYYVKDVQWISYFSSDGEAIHARTWDLPAVSLGVPSSHGCLGVTLEAALHLYRFAQPGTPVFVHD
jgi:hypothetical protein